MHACVRVDWQTHRDYFDDRDSNVLNGGQRLATVVVYLCEALTPPHSRCTLMRCFGGNGARSTLLSRTHCLHPRGALPYHLRPLLARLLL